MWICPECRTIYRAEAASCERDAAPLAQVFAHQTRGRFPLLGKVVGDRYRLIGGLGKGGLGTVYLAEHQHLGHLFAIKFLEVGEQDVSEQAKKEQDRHRRDFLKEARVASLIRNPSVVGVSDFGEYAGIPFLVMDYVPGRSLLQEMERKGRFSYRDACDIALRIAEALSSFHERRLVHRDLKPANVILDPREDGRLTLVDLGLVKDLAGPGGKDSTHPLALRGTPGYLAPEQVPGWVLQGAGVRSVDKTKKPVDPRVDIYALGVILYEMLAGEPPYPDGSNTQVIVFACTQDPKPLHTLSSPIPHIIPADPPVGLEKLVLDTMSRDREKRPASARDFIDRLKAVMAEIEAGDQPAAAPAPSPEPPASPGPVNASSLLANPMAAKQPPAPSVETLPDDSMGSEYDTMVFDTAAHDSIGDAHEPDGAFSLDDSLDGDDATVAAPMSEIMEEARAARRATQAAETKARRSASGGSRKLGLWLGLLLVCAAAGAGAWWASRGAGGARGPDQQNIGGEKKQLPVNTLPEQLPTPPPQPLPPVDAEPPPQPDAAPSEEEGPDAALAEEKGADAPSPKRRRARRTRKRKPPPPPKPVSEEEILSTLLEQGDIALREEAYQRALRNYRRFLARAPREHAKYYQVRQRVRSIEQLTRFEK